VPHVVACNHLHGLSNQVHNEVLLPKVASCCDVRQKEAQLNTLSLVITS
jgi:hypothetical protein